VDLLTSDHVRLVSRRWPARGTRRGTVVLAHGFAAGVGEARVVALATALSDAGLDVVGYDARGHGGSDGASTLGDREALDVAAAVRSAGAGARVVVVGASMGAIAALRYAASVPGTLAGVVSVSCPARWRLPRNARGVLSALMTKTPLGRWASRRYVGVRIARSGAREAPPCELVASLGVPLAVVHGRCDPFIDVADAELLYEAALEPRHLEVVEGLGHAFDGPAAGPVLAAVDWCLTRAAGAVAAPMAAT
jgi:alpha-beta hydrolase superfamily lysophospholipase